MLLGFEPMTIGALSFLSKPLDQGYFIMAFLQVIGI